MFADQIAKCLPDSVTRRADPQRTWLAADECAGRMGWNDWSKHHALQSLQLNVPPFSYQLNHGEMLRRVRRQAEQLAPALAPASLRAIADEYRQLISASPDDWVFHKNLAQVLQELEDPAGAAESWRQVEKALPQNVEAPLQINLILTKEGKLAEAAEEYVKAFKLDRNAAEWSFAKLLNETGARIAQKAGAEPAVPLFEQALALKSNFAEAHISLGSALNALGKTNQAREHFRAALRHPPTTPQGLVSLGEVCYQQGWTNEALRSLRAALALDPTDVAAHFHLGVVLFDEKENPAALDQFREVLRLDPDNTKARQYLIQTNR
jgi:tetratricopeptide (TPR) repeat protein